MPNVFKPLKPTLVSRRTLLRMSGLTAIGGAGVALVGCSDDKDAEITALRERLERVDASFVEAVLAEERQGASPGSESIRPDLTPVGDLPKIDVSPIRGGHQVAILVHERQGHEPSGYPLGIGQREALHLDRIGQP